MERRGLRYKLDISDYLQWFIYYGLRETGKETLLSLVEPGNIVFDVGTNVGEVAMHMALVVGEAGHVHSFEPGPEMYSLLTEHVALNGCRNISANNFGLAHVEEEFCLYRNRNRGNEGGNRILPLEEVRDEELVAKIRTIPLDLYVEQKGIKAIDLIKIDVEGFEMKVLMGAAGSIARFRPKMFIEINDSFLRRQGSCARELIAWIEEKGYRIVNAQEGSPVTADMDFTDLHFDAVCHPR